MKTYIFFIGLTLLISCNEKPKCNDDKVKEIALKILKEKIEFNNISNTNINRVGSAASVDVPSNTNLKSLKESDSVFIDDDRIISTEDYLANIFKNLKLKNIITAKELDSLNKCNCQSHFRLEYLGDVEVNYTVQMTDDGEQYVELYLKRK